VEALLCGEILGYIVVGFMCVEPLRLEGVRGKKITPSVGWEVPVKFWIASEEVQVYGSRSSPTSTSLSVTVLGFKIFMKLDIIY
jgi:hypothetical protein